MKFCSICKQTRSLSEFSKNKSTGDGFQTNCKSCRADILKTWRRSNRETYNKNKRRAYKNNPHAQRLYANRFYREHPEVVKSRGAVRCAIKSGKLEKWPCQICGNPQTEGHHVSYDPSMWLSVTWLCGIHHREVHAMT